MTIQKGDTVRIGRVVIKRGYAKQFIQFIADNIDLDMLVTHVSDKLRGVTVYSNGVHEEFAFDEVFKV